MKDYLRWLKFGMYMCRVFVLLEAHPLNWCTPPFCAIEILYRNLMHFRAYWVKLCHIDQNLVIFHGWGLRTDDSHFMCFFIQHGGVLFLDFVNWIRTVFLSLTLNLIKYLFPKFSQTFIIFCKIGLEPAVLCHQHNIVIR